MFPIYFSLISFTAHTPDNSFMGFVVDNNIDVNPATLTNRENNALVYGKLAYMWLVSKFYSIIVVVVVVFYIKLDLLKVNK